ncbi:MAG: N-6 DNA methylase [Bacteroidales bacterium]|nr:N-6 DNA methylase [Bacteroidales bacterium]
MTDKEITPQPVSEVVVNDDQLICALTNQIKKATDKELALQSMIGMLTEEYGFSTEQLERDYAVRYEDPDGGRARTKRVELAVFEAGRPHDTATLIRVVAVREPKVKPEDRNNGVEASLEAVLSYTDCEFGCWTNGEDLQYMHVTENEYNQVIVLPIDDFPGEGQTLEDLEHQNERTRPRKPANDSLVKTFHRCHNYLYGNEGRKKDAFWELLNIIFTKMYDEKRRYLVSRRGESYRRHFWVGPTERHTPEGQARVAERIKGLFDEMKASDIYKDVFDEHDHISISDTGLAYIASELSKYSFLDATVDVKGTAYETIVSNTLKQEAGQFFTPRNVIKCMVEMLDPDENTRILDPACGSGGFLVGALDHVRRKMVERMYDDLDPVHREQKLSDPEIDQRVANYAHRMVFGFDFDPDLKKAARMNMVMAGDGHSNIYNLNSLDYPDGTLDDVREVAPRVLESIAESADRGFAFERSDDNAQGRFDMIFTNPPFGSNVDVAPQIAEKYQGAGHINGSAPEVVFIEACYNFLKPGGRMGIVLPDGILGNPNHEPTRRWILEHFRLLASVDLPVETFLPQVGVQASLLFLQKKTAAERMVPMDQEDYDVFMAIVEKVGKDRRGNPVYLKDEDGADLLFNTERQWLSYNASGHEIVRTRRTREKRLADDLPAVAAAYRQFLNDHQR